MIYCVAKLTFGSVVFYCGWLEVLEQAEVVLLAFSMNNRVL